MDVRSDPAGAGSSSPVIFHCCRGSLVHPLKGGAEAVKPGANFLDNPGGKACFDLSLTQSWPSLRWDCSELGITVQVIHNNYKHIHDFIDLYIFMLKKKIYFPKCQKKLY